MQDPSNHSSSADADRTSSEAWEPCPAGLLEQAAARRVSCHRAQQMKRAISGATLALAGAACVLLLAGWVQGVVRPGGINCAQCHEQFALVHDYLIHPADASATDGHAEPGAGDVNAARQHLAGCRRCRAAFDDRYPGLLPASAATLLRVSAPGGPAMSVAWAAAIQYGGYRPAYSR